MNFEKLYINGEYVDSTSGKFIEVENPATNEIIGRVPRGNTEDVEKAAIAAKEAFKTFSQTSLDERVEIMEKFADYLKENLDEIAELITKELGSPIEFSKKTHVQSQIDRVEKYIEIVKDYEFSRRDASALIVKEPAGVIGCLTPWNYPLGQIIQKVVFAILAGNTIVLKPSQQTPLVAYYVVDGFEKAGLPKGVLNLVTGAGGEVGNAIATSKYIDVISFTGSTKGGREVAKLAQETIKRTTLELGGKSPAIFLDKENLDIGVNKMLGIVIRNAGQTCAAWSRAIVLESLREEFEAEVKRQFPDFIVGDPNDLNSISGPLASKKQYDKVTKYIEEGRKIADVLIEGDYDFPDKGYYVNPIVFTNVKNDSIIARDEIFGPVLSVIYVKDKEEAIEVANDTDYGLSGAVFGKQDQALEVAKLIRTGTITVNDGPGETGTPFGGYKMSGYGREGGIEGLEEYLETKTINVRE
ncbi:aldehyde dehydrogenase family protein [uncultured Helcococcus sp.]|uniref:aldehyde dehydrogenase family protein n=2 Tax=uncultured Helcococcus sp. TaxID=1072508 RepID=UPI00288AE94A|nr:aldehyde dehydrogenase family protein [uncultured Helcococcus sp.]